MDTVNNDKAFEDMMNNHAKTLKPDITNSGDKHLANTSHLMPPWKPGQSGNPNGRPKDIKYISEAIRELIQRDPALLKDIVLKLAGEAKRGNVQAFKEFADRGEGKVADKIEVKGELLITPDMRALAAREMIETKEEEAKLLNAPIKEEDARPQA